MQDALLQRLAERETGYYGKPGLSRPGAITKGAAPGMVHSQLRPSFSCSVYVHSIAQSQLTCQLEWPYPFKATSTCVGL